MDTFTGSRKITGNEDCLYLNVYTPELPSKVSSPRPVMVYIHGGGFAQGNGTDHDQVNLHGNFVERGIVVVSLNYRLGVLGFLSLDLKEASGNMGLKDQCLALKWVKKNINKFGGNPNDVTIYGISAGAASVEYQMVSPMSRGLFHKAIAQSGSSMSPWSQNNIVKKMSRKISHLKGKNFSDDAAMVQYLKGMPIEDLITTAEEVFATEEKLDGFLFGFCPCIEKPNGWQAFLEESEYELLKRGDFANVPYMASFCSREGAVIAGVAPKTLKTIVTDKNFGDLLKTYFPMNELTAAEYNAKFKSVYLSLNASSEPDSFAIDFFSDFDFSAGIYLSAKLMSKYNKSVYLYEFAYEGNLAMTKLLKTPTYKGTYHGDDWGYIVKYAEQLAGIQPSRDDEVTRQRLLAFFTNFIKYGKPTTEVNEVITTHWEPVEYSNVKYLVIDQDLKMKSEPLKERMRLFEELYEKYFGK
ncbi:esterase E4 [Amyelois transitella]|uniref:esterase E4 n=1 Tax=Amyelois transitella TaxID=680683 RepID=UPI00067AE354|nr:esterase E4 [Amyelois transitella]XP_013190633.1 esterase E4 [Amyelois transitella]XP_013190634.1 esterase E4 [Amyelois transitella]